MSGDRAVRSAGADDIAILLAYARKVAIVPGYGLAVAQAQHTCRELVDLLESRGVQVFYAIHPACGPHARPHERVARGSQRAVRTAQRDGRREPRFSSTDVAVVVGANDVVNPAARDSVGSPIFGMPILNVDESTNVVFMKRSMRPGFAGIDNALLYHPKTTLLLR